jgi:hypothetical protein
MYVEFGKIKTEVTWVELNIHSAAKNKIDVIFFGCYSIECEDYTMLGHDPLQSGE